MARALEDPRRSGHGREELGDRGPGRDRELRPDAVRAPGSSARGEQRGRNTGEVATKLEEEHVASTKGERSREPRVTSARRREIARARNRGDEREMGAPWEQRREIRELEGTGGPRGEIAAVAGHQRDACRDELESGARRRCIDYYITHRPQI